MSAWRRVNSAFGPVRNRTTHAALTAWLRMVASAAPCTPMWKPKMKMGSRIRLTTAPRATVIMPMRPKPWALTKLFMPRPTITKGVPSR